MIMHNLWLRNVAGTTIFFLFDRKGKFLDFGGGYGIGEWWYYGVEHGQHIGFFQKKTFDYLAEKHNLHFYTNGQNIHLLTDKHLLPSSFKWMIKLSKYIAPLIQRRMKSLTWKDMKKLTALSS